MSDILLIARALNFAAQRHANQRRKGEDQEPYVNHVAEVAELVAMATAPASETVTLCAGEKNKGFAETVT